MQFFSVAGATDAEYAILATSEWPPAREARDFIEGEWPSVAPFLDRDLPTKAAERFHAHFWEFYLAVALGACSVPLVPRSERRGRDAGPDLLLRNGIAIEAVTASAGIGPDAVKEATLGEARSVPDDAIRLRMLNAIHEKQRKLERYRVTGTHVPGAPFVVALNAAAVPSARAENTVPRIVRTLFPLGDLQVRIDVNSLEVVGSSYAFEDRVVKTKGAEVRTDNFLSPGTFNGISAVLYSCADAVNRPPTAGGDFLIVHNPHASAPLPLGALPAAYEYTSDGDQVHRTPGVLAPKV